MISEKQLKKLKPLPDQAERARMIKKRRKKPSMRIHLTKRQRRFAMWPAGMGQAVKTKYHGPKNYRLK